MLINYLNTMSKTIKVSDSVNNQLVLKGNKVII